MRLRDIPRIFGGFARKALSIIATSDGFIPFSLVRGGITPADSNRGLLSNIVMACVMWIQRTFTEAELVIQRRKSDGIWERVLDHPVETLIAEPNEFYGGDELWKATALSYVMAGNAYWWKVRNVFGEVIELWYIPHWMIRPVSDINNIAGTPGSKFIEYYQVMMGMNPPVPLLPRDVVHFRFGLDPEDTRLGLPPLRSVWREIEADMRAAMFSETVIENMGIPSLILSPKDAANAPTPDQLKELRDYLKNAVTGQNRGNGIVLGRPTDVVTLGFNPNNVNLEATRDISEERICAIIGIPAAVVGFGAGLQSTKVGATMRELVKAAWVSCLIPMQKTMGRQVTAQLLPDFISQTRRFRARFDMTEASAFQEEYDLRVSSVTKLVLAGVLRVDRAQQMLGLEVDTTREVYEIPTASPAVDPEAPPVDPSAPNPQQDAAAMVAADTAKMLSGIWNSLPKRLRASNGNGATR